MSPLAGGVYDVAVVRSGAATFTRHGEAEPFVREFLAQVGASG